MVKEIPLTQGKIALVDDEDYERIAKFKWWVKKNGIAFYARRSSDGKQVWMHREVIRCPDGKLVDHINRDTLDNRRCNLRVCTDSENNMNRAFQSNNLSGYKGVRYKKSENRWYAQISKNHKNIHIGCYGSAEEAARAYDEKAKELYGEFAFLNFDALAALEAGRK